MSTDDHWERWGAKDPYFGVLTDPRFRSDRLDEVARREFFASGVQHVDYVLDRLQQMGRPRASLRRVLDFGCGVGRLAIPFAFPFEHVVGVDVSPSMLEEARRNAESAGRSNISFVRSDDKLSAVTGEFDLVHSFIVLQHLEIPRGRRLFNELARRVAPGGFGVLHVTYGWDVHAESFGQPPAAPEIALASPASRPRWWRIRRRADARSHEAPPSAAADADPEMQMNYYNLSQLYFMLHRLGVREIRSDLTDHGGALGAVLFFRRQEG